MSDSVRIELLPLGKIIMATRGTFLEDVLSGGVVEFPCGGRRECAGCKIRVLSGKLPTTDDDAKRVSREEFAEGWRLACGAKVECDLKIELAQWKPGFGLDIPASNFTPRDGVGVAIDLGTAMIAAQLLDLRTAQVLAVKTEANIQSKRGEDLASRIHYAVKKRGQAKLCQLIREQIGRMILGLLKDADRLELDLKDIVIVGNTVMHHLFCGIDLAPLARYPFEPEYFGLQIFQSDYLRWKFKSNPTLRFLPCLGGFVGGDMLAAILATRLNESSALSVLIDLGAHGGVLLGNSKRILCAASGSGSAFDAVQISKGMRSVPGAVFAVDPIGGELRCRVLGGGSPRGICGSGLIDAIAAGLNLGWIEANGRLTQGSSMAVCSGVALKPADIRAVQLAKSPIAAALRILLQRWGATAGDLKRVYVTGPFGNCIHRESARRIGLIPCDADRIQPVGNSALLGAKIALLGLPQNDEACRNILRKIEHVSLAQDLKFPEICNDEIRFPDAGVLKG